MQKLLSILNPAQCWGQGTTPGLGPGGGAGGLVPISDFIRLASRLAGMKILARSNYFSLVITSFVPITFCLDLCADTVTRILMLDTLGA